ncbi:MAG TPA: TRAP transporter small permease [Sedimentisphaerales bacterium]|nr:TRAP transporter small permease [Sedimentisphaerales bacterium]
MNIIRKIKHVLDKFLEVLVIAAMVVLVADVVWQVFTRYVMRSPSTWTEELATFLMIWVGLLGSSVALNRGAHLGIDYFVSKLSHRKRLYVELFVFLNIAFFSLLVLCIGGTELVRITLANNQVSAALELKMGYVYLAIPVSGFFLVIYSAEILIECLTAIIKGKGFEPEHDFESTAAID